MPTAITWHSLHGYFGSMEEEREREVLAPVRVYMPAVEQYNADGSRLLNGLHIDI